ncbi:MAG: hypothetical protein WC607_01145 [Candidatus Micrarchaeia archaeon]
MPLLRREKPSNAREELSLRSTGGLPKDLVLSYEHLNPNLRSGIDWLRGLRSERAHKTVLGGAWIAGGMLALPLFRDNALFPLVMSTVGGAEYAGKLTAANRRVRDNTVAFGAYIAERGLLSEEGKAELARRRLNIPADELERRLRETYKFFVVKRTGGLVLTNRDRLKLLGVKFGRQRGLLR